MAPANPEDDTTRKFARASVVFNVKMRADNFSAFIEEQGLTLSAGGMFIATNDPRPKGSIIGFEFLLGKDSTRLFAGSAEVRWIRSPDQCRPGEKAGMGVQFVSLDDESRRVIDSIVRSHRGPQATGAQSEARAIFQDVDENELLAGLGDDDAAPPTGSRATPREEEIDAALGRLFGEEPAAAPEVAPDTGKFPPPAADLPPWQPATVSEESWLGPEDVDRVLDQVLPMGHRAAPAAEASSLALPNEPADDVGSETAPGGVYESEVESAVARLRAKTDEVSAVDPPGDAYESEVDAAVSRLRARTDEMAALARAAPPVAEPAPEPADADVPAMTFIEDEPAPEEPAAMAFPEEEPAPEPFLVDASAPVEPYAFPEEEPSAAELGLAEPASMAFPEEEPVDLSSEPAGASAPPTEPEEPAAPATDLMEMAFEQETVSPPAPKPASSPKPPPARLEDEMEIFFDEGPQETPVPPPPPDPPPPPPPPPRRPAAPEARPPAPSPAVPPPAVPAEPRVVAPPPPPPPPAPRRVEPPPLPAAAQEAPLFPPDETDASPAPPPPPPPPPPARGLKQFAAADKARKAADMRPLADSLAEILGEDEPPKRPVQPKLPLTTGAPPVRSAAEVSAGGKERPKVAPSGAPAVAPAAKPSRKGLGAVLVVVGIGLLAGAGYLVLRPGKGGSTGPRTPPVVTSPGTPPASPTTPNATPATSPTLPPTTPQASPTTDTPRPTPTASPTRTPSPTPTPTPTTTATPKAGPSRRIKAVSVESQGTAFVLTITGDGGSLAFKTLKLDAPTRYVVDFPGVTSDDRRTAIPVSSPWVSRVRVGHDGDKVRYVLDIVGSPELDTADVGGTVRVTVR